MAAASAWPLSAHDCKIQLLKKSGGQTGIIARFPDGAVKIGNFADLERMLPDRRQRPQGTCLFYPTVKKRPIHRRSYDYDGHRQRATLLGPTWPIKPSTCDTFATTSGTSFKDDQ